MRITFNKRDKFEESLKKKKNYELSLTNVFVKITYETK
jgi:hypothetical protein